MLQTLPGCIRSARDAYRRELATRRILHRYPEGVSEMETLNPRVAEIDHAAILPLCLAI